MTRVSIAEDFSTVPTGRFERDGDYNGTAFRQRFILPALRAGETIIINIDGLSTYGHSFFDEAIAGLSRPVSEGGEGLDFDLVTRQVALEALTETGRFFLNTLRRLMPSVREVQHA